MMQVKPKIINRKIFTVKERRCFFMEENEEKIELTEEMEQEFSNGKGEDDND